MIRHNMSRLTIVVANLDALTAPHIYLSASREYAEPDASEASGEAVYTRDQLDVQVNDPAIIAQAQALRDAVAQHWADVSRAAVKATTRAGAPLILPRAGVQAGAGAAGPTREG